MKPAKRILSVLLAAAMLLPCLVFGTNAETPTNKSIVYAFLKDELKLNDAAVCGVMANIQCESSFSPTAKYTEANGSLSFGLCQWNSGRLEALKSFCSSKGYTYTTLTGQLYFLKYELETSESQAYAKVSTVENSQQGAYNAGYNWARYFERCASSNYEKRAVLARDTYWPEYGYPVVRENIIAERIETLRSLLEGKYFTVDQKGCRLYEKTHKCANCLNKTIVTQQWFIDMFGSGIDASRQFPVTYYSDGTYGSRIGWSCYSFGSFAEWFIFKNSNTDRVDVTYEGTYSYDYQNASRYIQAGDLLRLSDSHSAIAVSVEENGVKVLDSNYLSEYNCLVQMHVIDWSAYSKVSISRATNSLEVKKYRFQYNAGGGSITGGDAIIYHYTVLSTNGLNMRTGAGTSYARVIALPYRTEVTATEFAEADGYTWAHVRFNGSDGWIVVSESWTSCTVEHVSAYYLNDGGFVIDGTTDLPVTDVMTAGVVYKNGLWTDESLGLVRDGMIFKGWSVDPAGGNVYPAGCGIIPDELMVEAAEGAELVTLYAVWEDVPVECGHADCFEIVHQPTCVAGGYTTCVCKNCGYTFETDPVPATGHSFTLNGTVQPTCTEDGYTEYKCTSCGAIDRSGILPATGHTFRTETVPATCTEQGYTLYNCTACGYSYLDDWTPAAQHAFISVVTDPTCESDGYTYFTCPDCGYSYFGAPIGKLGHDYSHSETVPPTCTEEGYTVHICSRCGDSYTDQKKPKAAHTFVDTVTPPTCTAEGFTLRVCSVCGETRTEKPTKKIAHSYVDTVIPATREAEGYVLHTCEYCGSFYIDGYTDKLPPVAYSVRFDPNGGTGVMADQQFSLGLPQNLTACAFTRRGYTFAGWQNDRITYADREAVDYLTLNDGDVVTLTAQWKVSTYRVRFEANGGTGKMPAAEFAYGTYAELPACTFTRAGYVFVGWADKRDAATVRYPAGMKVWNLTDGKETVLYAMWDKASYTVVYDGNGGRGTTIGTAFGDHTPVYAAANGFTRTGYTFVGWALTPDAAAPDYAAGRYIGTQSENALLAAGQTTLRLYAVWRLNTYVVHFDANGGTGSMSDETFTFGGYVTLPENAFTRAGYTFAGWSIRSGETDSRGNVRYSDGQMVWNLASADAGEVTLSAVWKAN